MRSSLQQLLSDWINIFGGTSKKMCFPNCAKYLLIILNVAIFIAGGILFVAGMLLLLESGIMDLTALKLLILIQYGSTARFGIIVMVAGYGLIATGGIIMILSVLGMCGAWKKIKCCLLIFIILVVLAILLQAALVGLYINLNSRSDEWLEGELKTQLKSYAGPTETDAVSAGFNKLFIKARCCGVTTYVDMNQTSWYTNVGSQISGGHSAIEYIPATCCKGVDTDAEITAKVSTSCTKTPTDYYTEGCYGVIRDKVFSYLLIITIVSGVVFLIQVASIVLSCLVMDQAKNRIRHANVDPSHAKPPPYLGIDSVLKSKGKQ